MALDNAQFPSELSIVDPPGTDPLSEGDDQIRTAKRVVFQGFGNVDKAVVRTADEMNDMAIKSAVNVFTARNDFQHAPTRFADGTAAAPGIAFLGTQTHGFFRIDSNTFGATVLGVQKMSWGVGAIQAAVPYGAPLGSAAFPAYAFTLDNTSGMWRGGAGLLDFGVDGVLQWRVSAAALIAKASILGRDASVTNPTFSFENDPDCGFFRSANNELTIVTAGVEAIHVGVSQLVRLQNENTVRRKTDTQARTGWRYTNAANQPMWAIYLGTETTNTLAFQRYSSAGVFQDIPLSIRQLNGLIRMSTLPTSSAGLIAGELWRNPVSPGFVAIV